MEFREFSHPMSMRTLLTTWVVFFALEGLGQFPFEVLVVDAKTGQPVSNASLQIDGAGRIHYSDNRGKISFNAKSKNCAVNLRHVAYLPQTATLTTGSLRTIELVSNAYDLPVATVSESLPDTVFGSEEYHVADYVFNDEKLYLLTYEREQRWKKENQAELTLYKGCRLISINSEGREIHNIQVPDDAIGFYDQYPKGVFLKFRKGNYFVNDRLERLYLEEVDDSVYHDFIEPVVDTLGPYIFFSNYVSSFPAFEYRVLDIRDTTFHHMRGIVDRHLMEQFRSEFKWLPTRAKLEAFKLSKEHGIDKEIIAGYMSGFPESIYFESLYAPLFVRNDTILIFDHTKEKLYTHNINSVIDSVSVSYTVPPARGLKWQKMVLYDEVSGRFYTQYSGGKDTYLATIDLRSGNAPERIKLHHPYPENIRVRNGMAYFIYRPFGSMQKRFLYKQQL